MTAADIKSIFGMTTAQGDELDEILAIQPAAVADRAEWRAHVLAVMQAGYANSSAGWPGFADAADLRAVLGLP
jgi:hypothetical protein